MQVQFTATQSRPRVEQNRTTARIRFRIGLLVAPAFLAGILTCLVGTCFSPARAQVVRRMTQFSDANKDASSAAITSDGTRIYFVSTADPLGGNPGQKTQIFRLENDGTGLFQVTSFTGNGVIKDNNSWSLSGDGSLATFTLGDPACNWNPALYSIQTDGSGLVSYATACDIYASPVVYSPSSGSMSIVYQYLPLPSSGGAELFHRPSGGGAPVQITQDGDGHCYKLPRVSETGDWVVYESCTNDDGQNPSGLPQIFRIHSDGSSRQKLSPEGDEPDLSGDGSRIVYVSGADPLATNLDGNQEIFLVEPATNMLRQLTFTTGGFHTSARVSADGAWVYFRSTASYFGEPARSDLYRVSVGTGIVERITGCTPGPPVTATPWPDRTGAKAVFVGSDRGYPDDPVDVFFVDQAAAPTIRVDKAAPTVVSWDVEPMPIRYDVIRGDVASLAFGPANSVDLGPLTCIEDESIDNDTVGNEDAFAPSSGQVFFYLQRGTQGALDGPGSFGQGSGGRERLVGFGGCPS